MKTGFIGTGSMGSILISSLIRSGAIDASEVIISNRTMEKAEAIAAQFPGMQVAASNAETVAESDVIFLCIKPLEYKAVIDEIQPVIHDRHVVVSITSPVLIHHLEEWLPCKIAKVIPSITNFECSGAILCMYSERMDERERQQLVDLLGKIGVPIEVPESHTRIASDLSSCGPAFLGYFVQKFVDAAVEVAGMPRERANELAGEMVLGTGKLLTGGQFTPETLQERVSVPGGVTAVGLGMLQDELDDVFCELVRTTKRKFEDDVAKVEAMLYGTRVD